MRANLHSISSLLLALVLLCAGCWGGTYVPSGKEALSEAYVEAFDSPVPPKLTVLHAQKDVIYDSEAWCLQMEAPTTDIEGILTNGFMLIPRAAFEAGTQPATRPKWWRLNTHRMATFYKADSWKARATPHSRAFLAHDAEKQIVWFYEVGSY